MQLPDDRAPTGATGREALPQQMRRAVEFSITAVLLVMTAPLMLCIALAIKWESPGPVFQTRKRVGQNRRCVKTLAFRTTLHDQGQLRSLWQPTRIGHF